MKRKHPALHIEGLIFIYIRYSYSPTLKSETVHVDDTTTRRQAMNRVSNTLTITMSRLIEFEQLVLKQHGVEIERIAKSYRF